MKTMNKEMLGKKVRAIMVEGEVCDMVGTIVAIDFNSQEALVNFKMEDAAKVHNAFALADEGLKKSIVFSIFSNDSVEGIDFKIEEDMIPILASFEDIELI